MTKFMEQQVEKIAKNENNNIINNYESILNRTITLLEPLGNDIFKSKSKFGKKFSTSYYDGIMIGISQNIDACELESPHDLKEKIHLLKNDEEFEKYTGTGAQNKRNVVGRIKRANEIFS